MASQDFADAAPVELQASEPSGVPPHTVGPYIRALAARHGVAYVETASDRQCADFARLSDSDVRLDDTERLLTALYRSGKITRAERNDLHEAYIRNDLGLD